MRCFFTKLLYVAARINSALILVAAVMVCRSGWAQAELSYEALLLALQTVHAVPDSILAERSFVLYDPRYNDDELKEIQQTFQKTGIDAVGYFNADMVLANTDAARVASRYFDKRAISFLILLHKEDSLFSLSFTRFNGTPGMVDVRQPAWRVTDSDLDKALNTIYRAATRHQPRKNLLINEFPETNFVLDIIRGKSRQFFAIDLKADKLAVPWFGKAPADSALVRSCEKNYPFRFGMIDKSEPAKALRDQGFLYVLKYVHAYEPTAKKLLGYANKAEHGASEFDDMVYKFYVQNLISGDAFIGTRWDASPAWQQSLEAYFDGLKKELGL